MGYSGGASSGSIRLFSSFAMGVKVADIGVPLRAGIALEGLFECSAQGINEDVVQGAGATAFLAGPDTVAHFRAVLRGTLLMPVCTGQFPTVTHPEVIVRR